MAAISAAPRMPMRNENASSAPLDWRIVGAFAGATILIHFLTNGAYGIFRDELYFIACGEHLSWGYVDLPPMVAAIAKFSRVTMGDSLFSIRFFPALAGGATVAIGGILAWELGGGLFAQFLAMLALMATPIFLGLDTILTMNAFDPIFWMGCAWSLIRIIKSGDPRWWLMFGLSAGLGLENKESIVFFGASLLGALMLTPQREVTFN
jgi:4-amino-4-deoxy-L-arabinose transferase-like glycosyltransferase